MKKLFNLRNLLLLIVFLLVGYIFCLEGCFKKHPEDLSNVYTTKIKFYFKEKPSQVYVDSLKNYFKNNFDLTLNFSEVPDSLLKIRNNSSALIVPIQCSCNTRLSVCGFCDVGTIVGTKPRPPQGIVNLLNLNNLPVYLRTNILQFDLILQVEPNIKNQYIH